MTQHKARCTRCESDNAYVQQSRIHSALASRDASMPQLQCQRPFDALSGWWLPGRMCRHTRRNRRALCVDLPSAVCMPALSHLRSPIWPPPVHPPMPPYYWPATSLPLTYLRTYLCVSERARTHTLNPPLPVSVRGCGPFTLTAGAAVHSHSGGPTHMAAPP